ncbi:MAG: type II toxin-antitoxin system Phd/YefM family antitoxin [Xenococcaceae cyanobacterium]
MTTENDRIGAGEFKTHCLKIIDRVNQTKQPITITKHGKPMAKLIPIEDETYSLFGCLANTVEIKGDIVESIDEVWEVDV